MLEQFVIDPVLFMGIVFGMIISVLAIATFQRQNIGTWVDLKDPYNAVWVSILILYVLGISYFVKASTLTTAPDWLSNPIYLILLLVVLFWELNVHKTDE